MCNFSKFTICNLNTNGNYIPAFDCNDSNSNDYAISQFEKMCEIGVFNSQAMNSAIFSFRRFELGSLHYAGGGTELETIGLFDTTVSAIEGL